MSVQISMRVSKEQKEKLVELSKKQNKSLTQYVLERCRYKYRRFYTF